MRKTISGETERNDNGILLMASNRMIGILKEIGPFEDFAIKQEETESLPTHMLETDILIFRFLKPMFGIEHFPFPRFVTEKKIVAKLSIHKEHGVFKTLTVKTLPCLKRHKEKIGQMLKESNIYEYITIIDIESTL